jgi:uncharacterized membrane protein
MEAIYIYVSTLFFIFAGFVVKWSAGWGNTFVRFIAILLAISGIVLSLAKLGFMLPPLIHP